MYLYIQKVKYLLIALFSVSLLWGSIQLNSVVYDLIVSIDETNSVQDFNPEGGITYYEPLVFTTTTGGDFQFNNYSSKLTGGTLDTSLLIYDNLQANLIIDEPWAFNDGAGIGFGGGQENTFQNFDRDSQAFQGTITLASDTTYAAVFTSFNPNTVGSMQISVNAPGQIVTTGFNAAIPEMKDTGLWIALIIGGFVAFCYFKIRSTL
tara:strand:- start:6635 stop:7255 length:621 start_codon:yes stop_codon:yes gene_type:complete